MSQSQKKKTLQTDEQTDRQTDGRTDRQTELCSLGHPADLRVQQGVKLELKLTQIIKNGNLIKHLKQNRWMSNNTNTAMYLQHYQQLNNCSNSCSIV